MALVPSDSEPVAALTPRRPESRSPLTASAAFVQEVAVTPSPNKLLSNSLRFFASVLLSTAFAQSAAKRSSWSRKAKKVFGSLSHFSDMTSALLEGLRRIGGVVRDLNSAVVWSRKLES